MGEPRDAVDLADGIKAQLASLQQLLTYLEDSGPLGTKEYLFCQMKLHEILQDLKRLERATDRARS
jgi:hypothetical protein